MRIADNVEMLKISSMGRAIFPLLVWDDERLVLIDAGFPGQTGEITQAIASAGFSAEKLTHIIITHQDIDHIGCVADLQVLSSAVAMAHKLEAPYISGQKTPVKLAAQLDMYESLTAEQKSFCDKMRSWYSAQNISISYLPADGEVLPICGGIEAIHTPGHTPGHICLFLRQSGILVSGDAVNIADGAPSGPSPHHTYDMPLALSSMQKALSCNPRAMVAYHGGYLKLRE